MLFQLRQIIQQPLKPNQKSNKPNNPSSYSRNYRKSNENINAKNFQNDKQKYCMQANIRSKTPRIGKLEALVQKDNKSFGNLQSIILKTDHSMQQILNSSIRHFQQLFSEVNYHQDLEQENLKLKNMLDEMKIVLKQKLETALKRQKDELSHVLQDYISLITKLLKDKQDLTLKIQDILKDNSNATQLLNKEWAKRLQNLTKQKDEDLHSLKYQKQQLQRVVDDYKKQAEQRVAKRLYQQIQVSQYDQFFSLQQIINKKEKIDEQQKNESFYIRKIDFQSTKIESLLSLLQKSQQMNTQLKLEIIKLKQGQKLKDPSKESDYFKKLYDKKVMQMQREYQEQFLQYEKAVRETLHKKDECIERLNLIIDGYRDRKTGRQA